MSDSIGDAKSVARTEAAIAGNKTTTPIDFTAHTPSHVGRNENATVTQDTTAWAVPGELPAQPNPGGNKFVPGKRGPQ